MEMESNEIEGADSLFSLTGPITMCTKLELSISSSKVEIISRLEPYMIMIIDIDISQVYPHFCKNSVGRTRFPFLICSVTRNGPSPSQLTSTRFPSESFTISIIRFTRTWNLLNKVAFLPCHSRTLSLTFDTCGLLNSPNS
ncbi:hypothetical protein EYC80_003413 [Monilinia laxa]|uniref:Uncharacterized protein n=1 Tax=Monilinia laxa TaxID=61186 RepID=A0A5N6KDM1_MONLA|nr:hypothetical protein EYC80_003413 [Monilinia laxa]